MKFDRLTNEEYNLLNKIAEQSGMDCWFELEEDECLVDYVYDRDEEIDMDLYESINMLDEGITSLDDYNLSNDEKKCYLNLIRKANFNTILPYKRCQILLYNSLVLLEEFKNCGNNLINTKLADELGITQKEYDLIMKGEFYNE